MLRRHPVLSLVTLAYIAFVCWVTLDPSPPDPDAGGLLSRALEAFSKSSLTSWLTYDRVEFIANIGMFVPIGFLLVLLLGPRRWWLVIVLGVAFTVFIESYQGLFLSQTRYSDVGDVIANSSGTVVGLLIGLPIAVAGARRARRRGRSARRGRKTATDAEVRRLLG